MKRSLLLLVAVAASALPTTALAQGVWRTYGASPRPPAARYASTRQAPLPPPAPHAGYASSGAGYATEAYDTAAYPPPSSPVGYNGVSGCPSCGDPQCDGNCGWSGSTLDGGCDGGLGCDAGIDCYDCVGPIHCRFDHRTGVWAEYLYLRARDLEIAYAVETDGPPSPPANEGIQVSPTAIVDPSYFSGYRVGFTYAVSDCASLVTSYTNFDTNENDAIQRTGTNDVRSLVTHPLTNNAGADWIDAEATTDIEFELIDLDWRWQYCRGPQYAINITAGVRYARNEQEFSSLFTGDGFRSVQTNTQFDGGGLKVGLDFERHGGNQQLFVYGKGSASFIVGEYAGSYFQQSDADPLEVNTSWQAGRIVPILELELGLGWQSCCGKWRATAGYTVNAWFNTVATDEFIDAVHSNDFTDMSSAMTFDGLVTRAEVRF